LSGTLRSPNLRVYTQPAKSDAEALAYLLTGRGLNRASRDQQVDIASAALNLGLAQGDPLLKGLSDRLGLDEFAVEGGTSGLEDGSLILGKYLNPNLYLGYTQGLFQPEGAVLLRLRVTEHIEVESRSGVEQSVDLFYRIEHD
jgi:translocation and assembly module TamB